MQPVHTFNEITVCGRSSCNLLVCTATSPTCTAGTANGESCLCNVVGMGILLGHGSEYPEKTLGGSSNGCYSL